jgi:hypothetical protein
MAIKATASASPAPAAQAIPRPKSPLASGRRCNGKATIRAVTEEAAVTSAAGSHPAPAEAAPRMNAPMPKATADPAARGIPARPPAWLPPRAVSPARTSDSQRDTGDARGPGVFVENGDRKQRGDAAVGGADGRDDADRSVVEGLVVGQPPGQADEASGGQFRACQAAQPGHRWVEYEGEEGEGAAGECLAAEDGSVGTDARGGAGCGERRGAPGASRKEPSAIAGPGAGGGACGPWHGGLLVIVGSPTKPAAAGIARRSGPVKSRPRKWAAVSLAGPAH